MKLLLSVVPMSEMDGKLQIIYLFVCKGTQKSETRGLFIAVFLIKRFFHAFKMVNMKINL